ncbi:MAG: ABC transporter permease [Candidatus Stygibacter australis]|nr:ABC transporter permease [Candidatus Stygibacter australis]MDP8322724.1 ABC transporter permease [Candidatus Stygibacter australis]
MKKFADFIALRYLKGHGRFVLSFSNLLSLIGICLGVFSLLTVISVMNGFDSDIRQRITAFRSDVKISRTGGEPLSNYNELAKKVEQYDYISHATPIISNELLIQSQDGIYGGVCMGIDFESYSAGTNLKDRIMIGNPDSESLNDNGIILGFDLAMNLNVSVRDYIQLSAPVGTEATPFGLLPRSRRFKVVGIFSSGIPDYDLHYCYYSLGAGQYFSGSGDIVDMLEVRTENADRAWYYRKMLAKELGDEYRVEDWSDYEANLFNAIKMEKVLMILVLSLIIILAGFNMAGNLNRLVTEKKRDIGILQAFGVNGKVIRQIFISSSFYIGVSGILLGLGIAYAFLQSQMKWEFIKIPISGFPIQELPVDIRLADFIIIPILALVITLLSAMVPAARSREVSTIEIIRNRG